MKISTVLSKYLFTLRTPELPLAALLMGLGTAFVYVFASLGPFIAIDTMGLNPTEYGAWNLIPVIGVITGSQLAARLTHLLSPIKAIFIGSAIITIGILIMATSFLSAAIHPAFLFSPLLIAYIGLGFLYSNSSAIATHQHTDKSNASAMMSFINMLIPMLAVLVLGFIHIQPVFLLPGVYCVLLIALVVSAIVLRGCLRRRSVTTNQGDITLRRPQADSTINDKG